MLYQIRIFMKASVSKSNLIFERFPYFESIFRVDFTVCKKNWQKNVWQTSLKCIISYFLFFIRHQYFSRSTPTFFSFRVHSLLWLKEYNHKQMWNLNKLPTDHMLNSNQNSGISPDLDAKNRVMTLSMK